MTPWPATFEIHWTPTADQPVRLPEREFLVAAPNEHDAHVTALVHVGILLASRP